MLTWQQFKLQLFNLEDEYRQDNEWVGRWPQSWNDPTVMARFLRFAFELYSATATNRLKLTVLGGTEIRTAEDYVRNFGVTAANGIQDDDTVRWVMSERARRAGRANHPDRMARNPDQSPAPVTGSGSILSEKGWTPILNDSLILGAIHAGQDFALGLTPQEQEDWQLMNLVRSLQGI